MQTQIRQHLEEESESEMKAEEEFLGTENLQLECQTEETARTKAWRCETGWSAGGIRCE